MTLTIFLTGGTSGIGKTALKKLFDLGHTIIFTGRTQAGLDEAEKYITGGNSNDHHRLYKVILDPSDFKSIQRAVATVKSCTTCLDVIVHNAAGKTLQFEQRCNNKVEGIIFNNAIAPWYLNTLLMPLLEKSSSPNKRILFLTSSLHDPEISVGDEPREYVPMSVKVPDDFVSNAVTWDATATYSLSKLGCVWNAFALADQYPQIPVITFCPGFVPTTNLNRTESEEYRWFLRNVAVNQIQVTLQDESADEYVYYITSPEINQLSGQYFRYGKVSKSSKESHNKEKRDLYMQFTERLIKEELESIQ